MTSFETALVELHPETPAIASCLGVPLQAALMALCSVLEVQEVEPGASAERIAERARMLPKAVQAVLASQAEIRLRGQA
ncbi:MAG: hypothetical protein ACR2J4_08745 [Deinococcus sp.]